MFLNLPSYKTQYTSVEAVILKIIQDNSGHVDGSFILIDGPGICLEFQAYISHGLEKYSRVL